MLCFLQKGKDSSQLDHIFPRANLQGSVQPGRMLTRLVQFLLTTIALCQNESLLRYTRKIRIQVIRSAASSGRRKPYRVISLLTEPETILKAISKVDDMDYHVLDNNCEHFAVWCKTGNMKSFQVRV